MAQSMKSVEAIAPVIIKKKKIEVTSKHGIIDTLLAQLLKGIEQRGSLGAIVKALGMSYSYACKKVHSAERAFGFALIKTNGVYGSTLTKEGKKLLDAYETLQQEIDEFVEQRFAKLLEE